MLGWSEVDNDLFRLNLRILKGEFSILNQNCMHLRIVDILREYRSIESS